MTVWLIDRLTTWLTDKIGLLILFNILMYSKILEISSEAGFDRADETSHY